MNMKVSSERSFCTLLTSLILLLFLVLGFFQSAQRQEPVLRFDPLSRYLA
jgi:hypothetical protein